MTDGSSQRIEQAQLRSQIAAYGFLMVALVAAFTPWTLPPTESYWINAAVLPYSILMIWLGIRGWKTLKPSRGGVHD